jgi:hypothetical protein
LTSYVINACSGQSLCYQTKIDYQTKKVEHNSRQYYNRYQRTPVSVCPSSGIGEIKAGDIILEHDIDSYKSTVLRVIDKITINEQQYVQIQILSINQINMEHHSIEVIDVEKSAIFMLYSFDKTYTSYTSLEDGKCVRNFNTIGTHAYDFYNLVQKNH